MTRWITIDDTLRHIPEDELHAYLDQALSRSQCVEIECHLAECRHCRAQRDAVAAVRDRITALLADTAPPRVTVPPPFERIVAGHQARRRAWIGRVQRIGLAAGLVLAAGFGWWAQSRGSDAVTSVVAAESGLPTSSRTLVAAGPVAPVHTDTSAAMLLGLDDVVENTDDLSIPLVPNDRPVVRTVPAEPRRPAQMPVVQVSAVATDEESYGFDGLWQSVDWQQARLETGGNLPRISGLPILDIQLQQSGGEERPIVVVVQQHPSGRLIRTVEGPLDRVEQLLESHATRTTGQVRASKPAITPPDYVSGGSERRIVRILSVLGSFPIDSLNAMANAIDVRQ